MLILKWLQTVPVFSLFLFFLSLTFFSVFSIWVHQILLTELYDSGMIPDSQTVL